MDTVRKFKGLFGPNPGNRRRCLGQATPQAIDFEGLAAGSIYLDEDPQATPRTKQALRHKSKECRDKQIEGLNDEGGRVVAADTKEGTVRIYILFWYKKISGLRNVILWYNQSTSEARTIRNRNKMAPSSSPPTSDSAGIARVHCSLVPIPFPKFYYAKRRFLIILKCRQIHGVLNVDEIKY
jgi:hypothetical protein